MRVCHWEPCPPAQSESLLRLPSTASSEKERDTGYVWLEEPGHALQDSPLEVLQTEHRTRHLFCYNLLFHFFPYSLFEQGRSQLWGKKRKRKSAVCKFCLFYSPTLAINQSYIILQAQFLFLFNLSLVKSWSKFFLFYFNTRTLM